MGLSSSSSSAPGPRRGSYNRENGNNTGNGSTAAGGGAGGAAANAVASTTPGGYGSASARRDKKTILRAKLEQAQKTGVLNISNMVCIYMRKYMGSYVCMRLLTILVNVCTGEHWMYTGSVRICMFTQGGVALVCL
jgi:hypothetical protein